MTFQSCEICGADAWHELYRGPIRDGTFGTLLSDALVARCGACGVDRLAEAYCVPDVIYESDAYRKKLQQGLDSAAYAATHDELQIFTLQTLWPESWRDKVVADIGCAGGALLDLLRGASSVQLAIEPSDIFQSSLVARGYQVFPSAAAAAAAWSGKVDLALSIQVIEHLAAPVAFLSEIRQLLAPGGRLLISTPNRDDILMRLLPDDFPAFFYRSVHRWYFDAAALATCARRAGFEVGEPHYVHRYGMANALAWLRDRRPTGRNRLPGISADADQTWGSFLERSGQADCLYLMLRAP